MSRRAATPQRCAVMFIEPHQYHYLWDVRTTGSSRPGRIHKAYSARLRAVLDRAKAERAVSSSLASKDAATMFLSLIQGLAFQFAIARLPVALAPEAERMLAMYLQTITAAADAVKRARRRPNTSIAAKKMGKLAEHKVHPAGNPIC